MTQFSKPQQDIVTVSQGSDVAVSDQLDQDTLESSSNYVFNDFPTQLLSENTTQGISDVFPSQSVFPFQAVSGDVTQNISDMFPSQPMLGDVMQQVYDLDVNHLLGLGQEITFPNPSVQMAAVHSAMSAISQMSHVPSLSTPSLSTHQCSHSTASRGMSDMPYYHPPSFQTTPFSSMPKAAKSTHRAKPPACVLNTRSTSSTSSTYNGQLSQITHTNSAMAKAIVIMGMKGAIDQAMDCMRDLQELWIQPTSTQPPGLALLLFQAMSFQSQATANLNANNFLNADIHAKLMLEFMVDPVLCQLYTELTDSAVHKCVAKSWYKMNSPSVPL